MSPVKTAEMQYVYVLTNIKDGKLYNGCTSDLRARCQQHQDEKVTSTKNQSPFKLMYYKACTNKLDAYARGKYLKTGMGKRYLKNRLKRALVLTG